MSDIPCCEAIWEPTGDRSGRLKSGTFALVILGIVGSGALSVPGAQ
jgi:hypothetical protein